MNRLALTLLGSLGLAPLLASSAHAQNAFTGSIEVFVDGKELKNEQLVFVTKKQCNGLATTTADASVDAQVDDAGDVDAGVEDSSTPEDASLPDAESAEDASVTDDQLGSTFRFRISSYTTSINNLEVWATGSTSDCSKSESRTLNTTTARPCTLIGTRNGVSDRVEFTFRGADIFKLNGTSAESCPSSRGNKFTVYFVPLANSSESNPSSPPAPIAGVQLPTATFTLYTELPNAPGNVRGGSGQSQLTLKWDKASGALATDEYKAYFDPAVGDDPECKSQLLTEGGLLSKTDGLRGSSVTKSLNTSLSELNGVAINGYVAAAVVTRDIAGNESPLSNVVCIQRVNTVSFMDNCDEDSKCKFDSCSINAPGFKTGGLIGLSLLIGLGVALSVRRRRHV